MASEDFMKSPWEAKHTHEAYQKSFLHMRPAPEYANGEVVLASTYRNIGFEKIASEGKVPQNGRDLKKRIEKGKKRNGAKETDVEPETWSRIISGTLSSPKQPNQASKRFMQISPVIPDAALYSLSARLSSNSWNPGALVASIVQYGLEKEAEAQESWNQLFKALSVGEDDDIWAKFLQNEFESWRDSSTADSWTEPRILEQNLQVNSWHTGASGIKTPAQRTVKDLKNIIQLKPFLTRRQWVSMLESILRIGAASHIFWVCNANINCFELMKNALKNGDGLGSDEIAKFFSIKEKIWRYNQYSATAINDAATGFIKARVGINLILHELSEHSSLNITSESLSNPKQIKSFIEKIQSKSIRENFSFERFSEKYQNIIESDPRIVSGKSGSSSNVKEFLLHVLGQRQTVEAGMGSYDQGYYLTKSGQHKSAKWIVGLGPVSVLSLVHACTQNSRGPKTISHLCEHLGDYGIKIEPQEVAESKLGKTLRNLGLVLDSPDAEGGMVLINPFEKMLTGI